jgi:hypothetical protein
VQQLHGYVPVVLVLVVASLNVVGWRTILTEDNGGSGE